MPRPSLLAVAVALALAACAHAPARSGSRAFLVDHAAAAADPRGCARLVELGFVDVATGARAPATLCLATIPDAPDGTWFWIDGRFEAPLPDGTLVVDLRIRANDFDPEGRGRAMRVALWDGAVDPTRSTGAFHGRPGRLHGGGQLFFEAAGARAELVLLLRPR
jgi:hypothetical protein